MIALDNVYKTYSTGVSALNGISLRIRKGEFVFYRRHKQAQERRRYLSYF